MKKVLIGIGLLLVLLFGALFTIPFLFKDKLKALLDEQIANRVNARVLYETKNVDLTVFRSFPTLTLAIDELAVVGQDSFSRDTLAYLPSLELNLDLMSVLSGNEVKVKSVELDRPQLNFVVLKSGKANWDIMKPSPETETDTTPGNLKLALQRWEIKQGNITYDDRSIPILVSAKQVDHTGKGDFEKNVFDMETNTTAGQFSTTYAGVPYIKNARLLADAALGIDLNKFLYTFKENTIKLNELPLGLAGTIAMPTDDIVLDLKFNAKDASFKSLLSVVPGMYASNFDNVKTDGAMSFQGYIKGISNDTSLPGLGLNMQVKNAMFKYPDLPEAARNINADIAVDLPDGDVQKLKANIKKLHLELGPNPLDVQAVTQGLEPMQVNGNVKARLNLAEVSRVFPMDGLALKGLLAIDATANGTYSKTSMPVVQAVLDLSNGYVKSKDFPAPIEQFFLKGTVANASGKVNDTRVNLSQFSMLLDGEPLQGHLAVQNLDNPVFDLALKGILDLTKLTKIFPQEGMTLAGRINADITSKGNMADVEAGRYSNVTSAGTMQFSNIRFKSTDLPQGMAVNQASMTFNNDQIMVKDMRGSLGKSDVQASGTLSNYMGYLFAENQPLKGVLSVQSGKFNVNEWMVEEPATTPAAKVANPYAGTVQPAAEGVVPVPGNLDLVLNASAGQVLYQNLTLQNLKGQVIIKDQVARLQEVVFATLGGTFITSGSYNTKDLAHPAFTFNLDIKNLGFKEAFESFNTIKTLAPVAKLLDGRFSTNFNFAGELGQDMMPLFSTLNGKGAVEVIKALVTNVQVLERMSSLTNIAELKRLVVENKKFDAQIINGSLVIKPFEVPVGNQLKLNVGGQNNLDGSIQYLAALDVPTGKIGSGLTQQVAGIQGLSNFKAAERVTLNFNILGSLSKPKVSLAGGSIKGQAKEIVKDAVKDIVKEKKDEAKERLEQERAAAEQKARAEAEKRKQEAEQKARQEIEKRRKEAEEKAKKAAEDKLKGIFKRP